MHFVAVILIGFWGTLWAFFPGFYFFFKRKLRCFSQYHPVPYHPMFNQINGHFRNLNWRSNQSQAGIQVMETLHVLATCPSERLRSLFSQKKSAVVGSEGVGASRCLPESGAPRHENFHDVSIYSAHPHSDSWTIPCPVSKSFLCDPSMT